MKQLYDIPEFMSDVEAVATSDLPWQLLTNRSLMLSGATGLIGSFLVDVLLYRNEHFGLDCKIIALGRDKSKAIARFGHYLNSMVFVPYDINRPLTMNDIGTVDYVLHLASNTHPIAYATDPIGTITTNIIGTANMLDFAQSHKSRRCLFASSNEVYGENRGDVELFCEDYCGYINCNTLRAGYPESKRCGEALCQAYIKQRGMDVVIARLTRSYGPTMLTSDTKAISQFIKKAVQGEDIVLKSQGTQYYSYTYMADAVKGLLTVLLLGETGNAYNIASESSDIMLKDLANIAASATGRNVVFEIPDETEKSGYSTATKARLDGSKLKKLGWSPAYNIKRGVERTINILQKII